MKIIIAGNSITLHGPAPQIGWTANHGMAASRAENDYVHVLARLIEARGIKTEIKAVNIAEFEREPESLTPETYAALRDFRADVIILRILENVPRDKMTAFGDAYARLIGYLNAGQAKVFCVGSFWQNDEGDAVVMAAAKKSGAVYVPQTFLHDEKYSAAGQFEHAGVAAHPSDIGMKAIAESIYTVMNAVGLF